MLLVGGRSARFGSQKALARWGDETMAERAWRVLGEACDERIAVGKTGALELPFDVVDDATDVEAPIAGVLAGLRAATHEVCVFLPVDCPLVDVATVRALGDACRDAAVPERSPLPGAWSKSALRVLEPRFTAGEYGLMDVYPLLDVAWPELEQWRVEDADTPEELARLRELRRE